MTTALLFSPTTLCKASFRMPTPTGFIHHAAARRIKPYSLGGNPAADGRNWPKNPSFVGDESKRTQQLAGKPSARPANN